MFRVSALGSLACQSVIYMVFSATSRILGAISTGHVLVRRQSSVRR